MPILDFIMPTYRRFPYANIRTAASWIYVCGEDVDLTQYSHITTLHLSCYRIPPPNMSNTLPSIATYFPNLTNLIIQNCEMDSPCFIDNLTDVPNSLIEVYLQGTYITDLTTILTYGTNILSLSIVKNIMPITKKISFKYKFGQIVKIRTKVKSHTKTKKSVFFKCVFVLWTINRAKPISMGKCRSNLL